MKVYRSLEAFEKGIRPVATIGTFDGVHLGHRKILKRLLDSAHAIEGESIVISFHPHPRLVLYPDDNPLRLLQSVEEKIESLRGMGIDKLMLVPFTREFARLTSADFIRTVLHETLAIRKIVIGYDHQFGRNRTGGLQELRSGGDVYDFIVEEIPARQVDTANVSSTKIRQALEAGEITAANKYLGYAYPLTGKVVHGQKLGRTLGYPTANIVPSDPLKLIPAEGVYLTEVWIGEVRHHGMLNIGRKPTVGEFPLGIEVNIFDFDQDIYGQEITVTFLKRIREDRKFDSLDALKAAIAADKKACYKWLHKVYEP